MSTNTVSKCGYEPTTVPITLGRGAFPLHKNLIMNIEDKQNFTLNIAAF